MKILGGMIRSKSRNTTQTLEDSKDAARSQKQKIKTQISSNTSRDRSSTSQLADRKVSRDTTGGTTDPVSVDATSSSTGEQRIGIMAEISNAAEKGGVEESSGAEEQGIMAEISSH